MEPGSPCSDAVGTIRPPGYRPAAVPQEQLTDQQITHLQMIQTVVARLANDSFLVKGWAVTISAAFLGFALDRSSERLAWASAVPIIAFWGLDSYFLRSERLFRVLYERLRTDPDAVSAFFMSATAPTFIESLAERDREKVSWERVAFSVTLLTLYVGLLASAAIVAVVIN
jgi:hypothetical protein